MSFPLRGPTPIFVGISGHRDVRESDGPALGRAIDDFFAQLAARYPHSDVVLLTGLAIGADQLGALHAQAAGVPYVAVLPMPLAAYREDFAESERDRFESLLAGAASVIELPLAHNVTLESVRDAERRRHQYAALGNYLVAHSAILLALYNGKDAQAIGGTSHVVKQARERRTSRTAPVKAFVYEISTPRRSDESTRRPPFHTTSFDDPDPALDVLASLDRWNARAAGRFFFDAELCSHTFAVADAFAIEHQHHTHRVIDNVYWFTLASAIALQAYEYLGEFVPVAAHLAQLCAAFFLGFILVAAVLVQRLHADEVQSRFQDYRVLAEGLRVQFALLDAGLEINAATHYRNHGGHDLDWVLRAIDVAFVASSIHSSRIAPHTADAPGLHSAWLIDQRAYYESASKRNRVHAERANRFALRWLRLSVAAGILVGVNGLAHFLGVRFFPPNVDERIGSALLLALGLFGTLAAIVKGKSSLRGYGVLAARYASMFEAFDEAHRRISESKITTERAATVFVDLAEAALAESAQWHSSERSRPLESMWGG